MELTAEVKYANQLNKMGFGSLTPNQQNVLFTIFTLMKESDENELELDLEKVLNLANIDKRSNTDYIDNFLKNFKDLQALAYRYYNDEKGEWIQENILPRISVNLKKNQIRVKMSNAFKQMYIKVYQKFTIFQLAEFTEIPSTYAKIIYRCLRQFESTGVWEIDYKSFKEILSIPKSYKSKDIDKQILAPAIEYLSEDRIFDPERIPFRDLRVTKIKKGKFIDKLKFEFYSDRAKKMKVKKMFEKIQLEHKREILNSTNEIKSLQEKLFNRWLKFNKSENEPQRYGQIKEFNYIEFEQEKKYMYVATFDIYHYLAENISKNYVEKVNLRFDDFSKFKNFIHQRLLNLSDKK